MFTKKITNRAGMKGLPLGYNNKRYMYKDEDTGGWLRVPIRRRMRKERREEVEEEWLKGTGSQDEVIKDIGGVALTLKKLKKRRRDQQQTGDLATLARVITQVHNLEPYYEGRFDMSNDCEYCKQRTGEMRENTAEHEKVCRFDENSRDRKIAECLEGAVKEAQLKRAEKTEARDESEQREVEKLMSENKFVKKGEIVSILWGERNTKAPSQERLQRMTRNFIRSNTDYKKYGRMIFEATYGANEQEKEGMKINTETWEMIREGIGCDLQLHTRAARTAIAIPNFTSDWDERHLGAKDPKYYTQKRPAAEVKDTDLEEHINQMETRQMKETDNWSIILTRKARVNRRMLEEGGYKRIATVAKGQGIDVHLRVKKEGRKTTEEVLTHLEALQKWGSKGNNEVDRDAFIKMAAMEPWKEDETRQKRTAMIVEAMGWMNSPTADRGVQTKEQVRYMIERGVECKSAQRIVNKTTDVMFDEYARDDRKKRKYCRKKQEQKEKEEQRKRKLELEKERENKKSEKEAEQKDKKERKRKVIEERKRARQEEKEKKRVIKEQEKEKKRANREKKKQDNKEAKERERKRKKEKRQEEAEKRKKRKQEENANKQRKATYRKDLQGRFYKKILQNRASQEGA